MRKEVICGNPAALVYTWPGREPASICIECAPRLVAVARAMGFPLPMLPVVSSGVPTCSQHVTREIEEPEEEPQTMAFSQVSDPEDFTPSSRSIPISEPEPALVGGGGTFDGGGASSSWEPGPSSSDSGSSDSGSSSSDSGSSSGDSGGSFDP